MNINVAYRLFIDDRTVYCSPETLSYYKFYLTRFISWLDDYNTDNLSKYILRDYIVFLRSSSMKNVSVRTSFRPVKAFCKWMFEEDYINTDITIGVKLPRSDAAIVEPLTNDEVHIIDAAIIDNGYNALRNYCIFHLLLDCGLRRKEVVNLTFSDIKTDRIVIHNSKGNKDRIVLLPNWLYLSICNYHNSVNSDVNHLFLDRSQDAPITNDTIRKLFVTIKKSSGVNRIHAHLCRHTFATSFLQYGGNMEKLRLYMGHSDYEILKNYLHLSLIYPNVYKIDDIFLS
jgi:integrase/recombinase XerC